MSRTAVSFALVMLLSGCDGKPVADFPELEIELGEVSESHLIITYRSTKPLESLRFHDAGGYIRERRWEVLTAGYALVRENGLQRLQLGDGAEAQHTVAFRVDLEPDSHPRRYDHAIRFTNGWVAVYSGYLAASGMAVEAPAYIVTGDTNWMRDREVQYLFDPALPRWMAFSVRRHLPAILEVYRERLGLDLAGPVQVMMTFHPTAERAELTGAALLGQIHVGVHGTDWMEDSPWAERRLHRLLAHEAAHLWNAGLVRYAEGTPPSLYEGGAEALGVRALFALGLVDAEAVSGGGAEAARQCAAEDDRLDYSCGHALADEMERHSLARGGPDLFSLWGKLLRSAQSAGRRYDQGAWETVLDEAGLNLTPCRAGTSAHPVAGMEC